MRPNNGGSYSERLLRHLTLFPPTSRSISADHRHPTIRTKSLPYTQGFFPKASIRFV